MNKKTQQKETATGTANSTADRAIEILLAFSQQHPVWTAQEISEHFRMSKSTTYRYIGSLKSYSLIVDNAGGYTLGPKLFQMAQIARQHLSIIKVAEPEMRKLADTFKEIVILNERNGSEVITLNRIESPHRVTLASTLSHILPWPSTGSAKTLLAYASEAERLTLEDQLTPVPYTSQTIQSIPLLLEHIQQIRQQGYAITDEEQDEGVWGSAVPIMEQRTARYALAVVGPKFRIPVEIRENIITALKEASTIISRNLNGY